MHFHQTEYFHILRRAVGVECISLSGRDLLLRWNSSGHVCFFHHAIKKVRRCLDLIGGTTAVVPIATASGAAGPASIALVLLTAGLLALAVAWRDVRTTTLVAGWWWTLASLCALATGEALVATHADPLPAWVSHLRYAAAMTTFCPLMALLGSKRPQHRAWQLIVLTFLGVLVLPAAEALLFYPTEPLSVHSARRWFLLILVAVGAFNSLPTRYWPTGLLTCLGQVLLMGEYLPLVQFGLGQWQVAAGIACLVAGLSLRAAQLPRGRRASRPPDRLWFDFRDSYGTLWALRVADRFNDTARRLGWGVRLGWNGLTFDRDADQHSPGTQAAVNRGLRMLLRRFVSPEWIARKNEPRTTCNRASM